MIDITDTAHRFTYQFYEHKDRCHATLHIQDYNFQTIKFGNTEVSKSNIDEFEVIQGNGWTSELHEENGAIKHIVLEDGIHKFECTPDKLIVTKPSNRPNVIMGIDGTVHTWGHTAEITTYTQDRCETYWK